MKVNLYFISILLLALTACTPQKYRDYSKDEKFHHLIGDSISTLVETEALGVTFGSSKNKKIDYIYIMPKPNFSGPEVLSRNSVVVNSIFKIVGVYGSDSAIFKNSFYFRVVDTNKDILSNFIYLIEFSDGKLVDNAGLDSDVFKHKLNQQP